MRALVVDHAVLVGPVAVGAAGLGDDDRRQRGAVAGAEHDQPLAQRVRHDRPAEVGGRVAEQLEDLERQLAPRPGDAAIFIGL